MNLNMKHLCGKNGAEPCGQLACIGRRSVIKALGIIGAAAPLGLMVGTRSAMAAGDDPPIRVCTQLFAGHTSYGPGNKGAEAVACRLKKSTLKARFLEGHPTIQAKVQKIASEWQQFCGIRLQFGNDPDADVRIAFNPEKGSWSYVGSCQYDVGQDKPTMNFGWLTLDTSEVEYRRVVLHEFGHALGMIHEHQNPDARIKWNEEAVYAYYLQTQGWDRQKTFHNVIERYDESETNHTAWDRTSIMQYAVPKALTKDGQEIPWNTELSSTDKEFIRKVYP